MDTGLFHRSNHILNHSIKQFYCFTFGKLRSWNKVFLRARFTVHMVCLNDFWNLGFSRISDVRLTYSFLPVYCNLVLPPQEKHKFYFDEHIAKKTVFFKVQFWWYLLFWNAKNALLLCEFLNSRFWQYWLPEVNNTEFPAHAKRSHNGVYLLPQALFGHQTQSYL